ncbi:unnamed protein product [Caenorhabditis angaria]|uniref:Uncharacterized protein n=1 Tax=Caenorhabditis angaria TaxID=860376 RepID=A0A9P1N2P5_9PELO|nr:unnamed protein product [Caenorhabditis angaria]
MEEYMETGYSSDLKNINQKYIPNSIQYSLAIAQNLQYLKENSTKLYERQLKSLYIQKCESNKAEALKFLKNLQSLFYLEENEPCTLYNCFSNLAMDSNCSRAAETLYKVVVANVKDVFRINDFKLGNFTKAYNNALSTLWLFDHPAEKSELRKMFEFFKK